MVAADASFEDPGMAARRRRRCAKSADANVCGGADGVSLTANHGSGRM